MSVKVGVRVRPFNQREVDLNCNLCVDMMGQTTRLFQSDDPEKFRDFTFDYSFWSHDQFHTNDQGYFEYTYNNSDATARNMQIRGLYFNRLVQRFFPMPGRDITAASSPMGKPEQENRIQWWGTERIKYLRINLGNRTHFLRRDFFEDI